MTERERWGSVWGREGREKKTRQTAVPTPVAEAEAVSQV